MPELTEAVDLCAADGTLSPRALGWTRRPLHRCNLPSRWGRTKRWDWWCVADERIFLALVVADIDYLRGGVVSLFEVESGRAVERIVPSLTRVPLPERAGEPVRFERRGVEIDLSASRLLVRARGIDADVALEPARDSLGVVIPGDGRFWYTCKQIGLPARGRVAWPGGSVELDGGARASLDFGRGVWPARTRWSWAAASGPKLAFNLGGRWTDGSGATENGLFADGVLHKIEESVRFDGDRIEGRGVSLRFAAVSGRRVGRPPLFGLDWRLGRFSGRILDWDIQDMFGWCEALDILW